MYVCILGRLETQNVYFWITWCPYYINRPSNPDIVVHKEMVAQSSTLFKNRLFMFFCLIRDDTGGLQWRGTKNINKSWYHRLLHRLLYTLVLLPVSRVHDLPSLLTSMPARWDRTTPNLWKLWILRNCVLPHLLFGSRGVQRGVQRGIHRRGRSGVTSFAASQPVRKPTPSFWHRWRDPDDNDNEGTKEGP